MQEITVKPVSELSWTVELSGVQNPLVFMNGALAEKAAKRLAKMLASAGRRTQISIYLRDGSLGGRLVASP